MHEVSLVRNIFNTLNSEFSAAEVSRIKTIRITAGLLANVEPILLQNAFEAVVATDSPEFKTAQLKVQVLPILIECEHCGKSSEIKNYTFLCSHCGKPSNNVVQGNELLISGVDLADE